MGWLCSPHPGSSLAPEMQGQAQKLRILGVGYVTDPQAQEQMIRDLKTASSPGLFDSVVFPQHLTALIKEPPSLQAGWPLLSLWKLL